MVPHLRNSSLSHPLQGWNFVLEGCCGQIGEGHDRRIPPGARIRCWVKGFRINDLKSWGVDSQQLSEYKTINISLTILLLCNFWFHHFSILFQKEHHQTHPQNRHHHQPSSADLWHIQPNTRSAGLTGPVESAPSSAASESAPCCHRPPPTTHGVGGASRCNDPPQCACPGWNFVQKRWYPEETLPKTKFHHINVVQSVFSPETCRRWNFETTNRNDLPHYRSWRRVIWAS